MFPTVEKKTEVTLIKSFKFPESVLLCWFLTQCFTSAVMVRVLGFCKGGGPAQFLVRVFSKGYFFEEILLMELYLFKTVDCETCFCPGDF